MKRIETLRAEALGISHRPEPFLYHFYKTFENTEGEYFERYAISFDKALNSMDVLISDGELIVGKQNKHLEGQNATEWNEKYCAICEAAVAKAGGGQDSHMAIDYPLVLSCGLNGIIDRIDGYLADCAEEKKGFYKLCKACLKAVIAYSERYADKAASLADAENDPVRKAELTEVARICRKVPAEPAESFHEALQSVNFVTHTLCCNPYRRWHQQFQLGHPDRYLLPYYEKDIKSGAITKERAQLLLDLLGIQINTRVPNGLSCGYMVGGRDANGNIVQNELTEMLMQVIDDIRLVYPSVGLCYTEGLDDRYLEKACEILSHGRSHPAIFNDDIITKGLISYGIPENEAHEYIHSTCVEITPVASSNVWVASPYTNMAALLLNTIKTEHESFEALINAMFATLDESIRVNFEGQCGLRRHRAENSMNPLLSCFVNDCLALGTDIEKGGGRYNWVMPSFVGMANLVDSLYAIKTLVYDKKELTLSEYRRIVESNYEGNEALRQRILNGIPKYGNDIDDIDGYFGMITDHIAGECARYTGVHRNARLIPSVFCWIKHERFGKETGATPDGRVAGFPLGDGSGPCQGREMKGPTASILSSTKWDHSKLIGGVAVNMKFSKSSLGESSVETMKSLIKVYLERGGFEMQINVVDREMLEKAMTTPEAYRDLVVRVGGYSDYFVRLSKEMQQEVVLRTEHTI